MADMLSRNALLSIDEWIRQYARPLEVAKWDFINGTGSRGSIVDGVVGYQNPDGGFGNGFEPDLVMPFSSAIGSAEAIFTLLDYGLDGDAPWFGRLLSYFMDSVGETPSFWEPVPPSINDYPRPPWWSHQPDVSFSPNPCAVVAAGLLLHGNPEQRSLGERVAQRCLEALMDDAVMHDHDIYCMQRLVKALGTAAPHLTDGGVRKRMADRVREVMNTNPSEWGGYVAQPLDLVDSPDSPWYPVAKGVIPENIRYWLGSIAPDGVWAPNFSWGNDSPEALAATRQWKGYMAVKRVRILMAFGAVER